MRGAAILEAAIPEVTKADLLRKLREGSDAGA